VKIRDDGRVISFHEKISAKPSEGEYLNVGVYVFKKRMLEYVASGREVSLEKEVFPEVVRSGEPVYGYVTNGFFIDIGTPDDYSKFQKMAPMVLKLDN